MYQTNFVLLLFCLPLEIHKLNEEIVAFREENHQDFLFYYKITTAIMLIIALHIDTQKIRTNM